MHLLRLFLSLGRPQRAYSPKTLDKPRRDTLVFKCCRFYRIMNWNLFACFLALGIGLGQGDTTLDAETDAAFKELEAALNDRQQNKDSQAETKKLLQEIKDEITTTKPEYGKKVLGMTKSLSGAVPKLRSTNELTVAEGALLVIAGIAEHFPPPIGIVLAPLATLVSSILGYLTPQKTNQAIQDAMRSVLNDARDKDIKEKIEGYRAELLTIKSYLQPKKKQTLDRDDVGNIVSNVNAHTGARELESLAKRIQERAVSTDKDEAKRAFEFSLLYVKIATFRDAVLEEVISLFRQAGDENEAESYLNVKVTNIEQYKTALRFLNEPEPKKAGALVHYYPIGHSDRSKLISDFLKMAKVETPMPWIPKKYVLRSVKWPSYHLERNRKKSKINTVKRYKNYMSFVSGTPVNATKIQFIPRSDGYYEMKHRGGFIFADDPTQPTYTKISRKSPNDDQLGHWVVIKYFGKDVVTISGRKWPDKFFNGQASIYSVKLLDGNSDNGVQFNLDECFSEEGEKSGWKEYNCPEYTTS